MSEVAEFVRHNGARVSPKILHGIHKKLPQLKLEFAEINAPRFPHLVDQLEFLAGVVEDYAEGADQETPYAALADACFALAYAHNQSHLIINHSSTIGRADDSSVVRAVLIAHEKAFAEYARRHGIDWDAITTQA